MMASAFSYTYHDPYKVPAGIATLLVHVLFFGLLYIGVNWQSQEQQGMVVDLWDTLPDVNNAPAMRMSPQKSSSAAKSEQAKPHEQEKYARGKTDINMGKTRKQDKSKSKMSRSERKQAHADMSAAIKQQELAEQQAMDARAKQAAAMGRMIDEYKAKISAKIRRNIVPPPDVADDAVAEFNVTLLPGGDVLDATLIKSSGNQAYDDAVDRAILKASPLPVPEDPDLFNSRFRNLRLKFRPKDVE